MYASPVLRIPFEFDDTFRGCRKFECYLDRNFVFFPFAARRVDQEVHIEDLLYFDDGLKEFVDECFVFLAAWHVGGTSLDHAGWSPVPSV